MPRFVRQLLGNGLLLLALYALTFLMMEAQPGDPALARAGERADAATLAKIREAYGLDQPVLTRFWSGANRIFLHADPGISFHTRTPVAEDLARYFPATVELALSALMLAVLVGVPLGVMASRVPGRWADVLTSQGALMGVSIPVFVLGYLLILVFGDVEGLGYAGRVGSSTVIPADRHYVIFGSLLAGDWALLREALGYLLLPAVTLATIPLAIILRLTRSAMLEVSSEDFLRTARAKGVRDWWVTLRHALPVAAPAIVTVIGLQAGLLLSGAVLTEGVFSWPGMGSYLIDSLAANDFPAVQGSILLFGAIYIASHMMVEIVCPLMDPRLREV